MRGNCLTSSGPALAPQPSRGPSRGGRKGECCGIPGPYPCQSGAARVHLFSQNTLAGKPTVNPGSQFPGIYGESLRQFLDARRHASGNQSRARGLRASRKPKGQLHHASGAQSDHLPRNLSGRRFLRVLPALPKGGTFRDYRLPRARNPKAQGFRNRDHVKRFHFIVSALWLLAGLFSLLGSALYAILS